MKKYVNGKIVDMTDEEIAVLKAERKEWEDGAAARKLGSLREQRNRKLAETDWVVIREREEGGSVSNFTDWKKYRQELRDITKTYKSLDGVKWPEEPSS
jgi:hypothetical protein